MWNIASTSCTRYGGLNETGRVWYCVCGTAVIGMVVTILEGVQRRLGLKLIDNFVIAPPVGVSEAANYGNHCPAAVYL